jgi:hypothetical protein
MTYFQGSTISFTNMLKINFHASFGTIAGRRDPISSRGDRPVAPTNKPTSFRQRFWLESYVFRH